MSGGLNPIPEDFPGIDPTLAVSVDAGSPSSITPPPAPPPPEQGAKRVGRAREVKQRDGGAAQGSETLRRRRARDLFGFGLGGPLV